MIEDRMIREAAQAAAYKRGCLYYENGAVDTLFERGENSFQAEVIGSSTYEVEVELTPSGEPLSYHCDCPANMLYSGACKHIVAVLKALQARQKRTSSRRSLASVKSAYSKEIFSFYSGSAEGNEANADALLTIEPRLFLKEEFHAVTAWLELRIGYGKMYVIRNLVEWILQMQSGEPVLFGRDLTVYPRTAVFDEISEKIWQLISDTYADETSLTTYSSIFSSRHNGNAVFDQKRWKLSPTNLDRFLTIMEESSFACVFNGFEEMQMSVKKGKPDIAVDVKDHPFYAQLTFKGGPVLALDPQYQYLLCPHQTICKLTKEEAAACKPLLQSFAKENSIKIDQSDMGEFFSTVLPEMEKAAHVSVDESFMHRFEIMPLVAEIYFDYYKEGIRAELFFCYDSLRTNPLREDQETKKNGQKILIRDKAAEGQILRIFDQYRFQKENGFFIQEDEDRSYEFLVDALPRLTELADIFYAESFKQQPVQRLEKIRVGVHIDEENVLKVSLKNDEVDFDELINILASYRLKRKYHRLKDGTFLSLADQQLSAVADFVENTGIKKTNAEEASLPLAKAVYIDTLAKEEGLRLERSASFRQVVNNLLDPSAVEAKVPAELAGILRSYQITGFQWLSTLAHYGLGGILADDMGLGKTLQVIAFLLSQQTKDRLPSLVVAPTSLLYNWMEEIERFAPTLRAVAIAGEKKEREILRQQLDQTDVVITTYNMLKKDIEEYEQLRFSYCFLDEAQHIKNPNTQNAKAVKRLHTGGYFALTGTPIENTLTELWSIFDFLMPGYLLSHRLFKQRFEVPIIRGQDSRARKNLHRHIAPFVLRRMKQEVLRELPDKVENKMVNEMTAKQAKVYTAYFAQAKKEFAVEMAAHGFEKSRVKILAILTRLRQICCHPALFLENYTGGCGKLDMLEEVVENAVKSGHRLLLFSQFTTMLSIIRDKLDQQGISYEYLDGKTPSWERMQLVKDFNSGRQSVFLISLKAGGTGLNLTGADMVIHYDPWWNPAVEDQATDRAYRLGQKKNVQVLKFITKNTIEEQIFALQQKKKALIDQMIQPGENFLSKLTEEEIRSLFS